jgi:hypothetical protein
MFAKTLLLGAGFAALALSEPIPQAAATTSFGDSAIPTTSFDDSALSSELASLSSAEAFTTIFSDMPTLPASVESVLATAIPTTYATADLGCDIVTATPDWYKNLPAGVKSALSSYDNAWISWSKEHSAALASLTSGYSFTVPAQVCTTGGAAVVGTTASTGSAPKNTGSATGAGAGSTGTASSGSAAQSTSSKAAAAPKQTGAVAVGFAGVVGVLGLMAAL